MSNFPSDFDDDVTLPVVNDNLTEIGGEAINAVRDAVFNIEQYLGLGANGTTSSVATRLGISLNPDGTIKSSAIASLGLVTLPITNDQIANNAGIPESKLKLDHRTQDLFNYITDMSSGLNTALGWIGATGSKVEPHLFGFLYRHTLDQIDVTNNPALYLRNKFRTFRDNSNSFTLINDMNNELLEHQFADGSPTVPATLIVTNDGSTYPATHAHLSAGIYLNTTRFTTIPQTATDLQQFADYIDSSSLFLVGARLQNLFSNGISRASRSSSFTADGYGQPIVPVTQVTAYLADGNTSSAPFDNIDTGDDIIEFKPSSADVSSNIFDAKFALVQVGDIVTINYGTLEIKFIIKEKKYFQSGGNKKYVVRINGRNYQYTTDGYARIDKPLFNLNKYGVLSLSAANNQFNQLPSLIVTNPNSAMALGLNFNPDLFDSSHYNLYLALFPNGNPNDGYTILPAIDVTGNLGASPGKYTLDSVVESTNNAFRQAGYNYRFVAFKYQGEYGIALADPYNNASFSIISGVVDSNGSYDQGETSTNFPNNVVGLFAASPTLTPVDPLGFGPTGSNIASPPYQSSYLTPEASQLPTKLFVPLKRNTYYVNGVERDKFALEPNQILDGYGDGYWTATVTNKVTYGNRVETTYQIPFDLDNSSLSIGKTVVVQSLGVNGLVNYGRFIIKNLSMGCVVDGYTNLTVYDAVHAQPPSPQPTLDIGSTVAIYFNADSVGFNIESATDFTPVSPFKRHFEVYADQNGNTFTHERGRIYIGPVTYPVNSVNLYTNSELAKLNIVKISPKLRGYQFATVNKITLKLTLAANGSFNGYLASYDGVTYTNQGPLTFGYLGQVTRFYDETNVEYIDIIFNINDTISTFTDQNIDFQLFPTLSLDQEVMLLGTCQVNDTSKVVNYIVDERQFGNTSEKDLTTSALNLIALGEKYLHSNGVLRGFDLEDKGVDPNPSDGQIFLTGGLALVNGKFIAVNDQTVVIPTLQEVGTPSNYFYVNWALCVNDKGEYQPIPLLDYDPVSFTPNNPNRIFTAYNANNATTYNLEATTFSNLINQRKDLTLLYVVQSYVTVGPATITLTVSDARKYVNDVDSSLYLKYTSGAAQGNFKNFISILNWVKYNSSFNSTVFLNGVNETVTQPVIIDCTNSTVTFDGLNNTNASIIFDQSVALGNNVTFKNLNMTFNQGLYVNTITTSGSNIHFENCVLDIIFPTAPDSNICLDFVDATNISFKNCDVTLSFNDSVNGGAAIRLTTSSDLTIENSDFTCNFTYPSPISSPAAPGDFIICRQSSNIKITDSSFVGNYKQFLRITSSSNIVVEGSSIRTTYDPYAGSTAAIYNNSSDPLSIADGLPVVTYSTTNLINTGRALIYSYVTSTLNNVTIDKCTFIYAPSPTSTHRLSFINFQLANNNTSLTNVNVTNCTFRHNNASTVNASTVNDIRAAVAIINTSSITSETQIRPRLINCSISNNYCNKNQLIVLTSQTFTGIMYYPGLVPENVIIENNNCGTIGYWVSASQKVVNLPTTNQYPDKESSLLIKNNVCHLINNMDHTGQYFLVSKLVSTISTNMSIYPSGNVIIEGNSCNWIHVGIAYEQNSTLQIINNNLTGYSYQYLNLYGDSQANATTNGTGYSPGYAIYVSANKKDTVVPTVRPGLGNDSICLIQGNTTSYGYWVDNTFSTLSTYGYYAGFIYSASSANICNNILKGKGGSEAAPVVATVDLILLGGKYNIVSNNHVYRIPTLNTISHYISFNNYESTLWDASGSYGMIVDNFFDSPYTSGTNEDVIYLDTTTYPGLRDWTAERNKNQTAYATIPLTNGLIPFGAPFATGVPKGFADFGVNDEYYITTANTSTTPFRSYVLKIHDEQNPAVQRNFGCQQDVSKYLPNNVKLISAKMGVRAFGSTVTVLLSNIRLSFSKFVSPSIDYTNLDSFANENSNDPNLVSTETAFITGSTINATPSTDTIPADINFPDNEYITGKNYAIALSLYMFFLRISNPVDFLISPVVIKYRW